MKQITIDEVLLAKDVLLPYGKLIKEQLIDHMHQFFVQDHLMFNMLVLLVVLSILQLFIPDKKNPEKKKEETEVEVSESPFIEEKGNSFNFPFLYRLVNILRSYMLTGIVGYTFYKILDYIYEAEQKAESPYTLKLFSSLYEKSKYFIEQSMGQNDLLIVIGSIIILTDVLYLIGKNKNFRLGFFLRGIARLGIYAALVLGFITLGTIQEESNSKWVNEVVKPYLNSLEVKKQITELIRYEVNPGDPNQVYVEFEVENLDGNKETYSNTVSGEQIHFTNERDTYIEYKVITKDINEQYKRGYLGLDLYISQSNLNEMTNKTNQ